MSAGNPIIKLRVSAETLGQIEKAIETANETRKDAPYDMSSWLRAAIREKLDHLARSRRKRIRKIPLDTETEGMVQTKPE